MPSILQRYIYNFHVSVVMLYNCMFLYVTNVILLHLDAFIDLVLLYVPCDCCCTIAQLLDICWTIGIVFVIDVSKKATLDEMIFGYTCPVCSI